MMCDKCGRRRATRKCRIETELRGRTVHLCNTCVRWLDSLLASAEERRPVSAYRPVDLGDDE